MLIKLKSGMTIAAGRANEPKYKVVGAKCTPLCEFGVAAAEVEDSFGSKRTVWVNCKVWRDNALLAAQRISKGSTVFIAGQTKPRSWTGNDGAVHEVEETEVDYFNVMPEPDRGDTLDDLIRRPNVTVQESPQAKAVNAAFAEYDGDGEEEGEIPF